MKYIGEARSNDDARRLLEKFDIGRDLQVNTQTLAYILLWKGTICSNSECSNTNC